MKTPHDAADFVTAISAAWTKSVDCIFDAAILCAEADERLTSTERALLIDGLPFAAPTFSKLVKIGNDQRLRTDRVRQLLPAAYSIMYAVSQCTDFQLDQAIRKGVLHPGASRADIETLRKKRVPRAQLPLEEDEDVDKRATDAGVDKGPAYTCYAEIRVPSGYQPEGDELERELLRVAEAFGVDLLLRLSPEERAKLRYENALNRFAERHIHHGRVLTRRRTAELKRQARKKGKKWGLLPDETDLDNAADWNDIARVLDSLSIGEEYERIFKEAEHLAKLPSPPDVPADPLLIEYLPQPQMSTSAFADWK